MDTTHLIPCNLCGSETADVVFEAGVAQIARIVKCHDCGLMFASPRGQLVDHEDYEQHQPQGLLTGVTQDPRHPYYWRYSKEKLQVRDFDATRRTLKRLHPEPGRMVEVGSGLCYLLRSYKDEGWDVLGVDPWRELDAFTRAEHGIETIPKILEDARLPSDSSDVVILLHVIEHVPDPVATMREIFRVLKPGGHMVLETPRYDTLMFKIMGRRERSLRQDGHIYFFTDASLQATYEKAGFRKIEHRHVGRSMTAERFLWNAANIAKSESVSNSAKKVSDALGLWRLRFSLNLHDMIRIVVEKPAD